MLTYLCHDYNVLMSIKVVLLLDSFYFRTRKGACSISKYYENIEQFIFYLNCFFYFCGLTICALKNIKKSSNSLFFYRTAFSTFLDYLFVQLGSRSDFKQVFSANKHFHFVFTSFDFNTE